MVVCLGSVSGLFALCLLLFDHGSLFLFLPLGPYLIWDPGLVESQTGFVSVDLQVPPPRLVTLLGITRTFNQQQLSRLLLIGGGPRL